MKKIILFLPLLLLISVIPAYSQETTTQDLYDAHDALTQFWLSDLQQSQFLTSEITEQSSELPIFTTFVNPNTNELVIGIDYDTTRSIDDLTIQVEDIIGTDVSFILQRGYVIEETCIAADDRCVPLLGALEISSDAYVGTLTLPAITTDGKIGFIMSGHVVGGATNIDIFQPNATDPDTIIVGTVITNPIPYGNPLARSSDSAFVEKRDGFSSQQKIFNPNGAPYNVIGTRASQVNDDIILGGSQRKTVANSVVTHTTGQVLSVGITISYIDNTFPLLTNQVVADYISTGGDSGSPIFSIYNGTDVEFLGIHQGRMCFTDNPPTTADGTCPPGSTQYRIYSPWESIQDELDLKDIDGTFLDIPSWIKNNAGWWANGQIEKLDFVGGIQFLIKENILQIPPTTQGSGSNNVIPDWIKNVAGYWATDQISDSEFVGALQYLIEQGIVVIQSTSFAENQSLATSYEELQITPLSNESITPVSGSNIQGCEPNCYSQTILSVDTGSTITFSNDIASPNTFTSGNPYDGPDGTWDSGLLQDSQSYSVTLNTPGTYQYYSQVHPWMQGSIIVGATPTNLPPTSNAGADQTVNEQTLVILSGSATDPENQGQIRYTWQQISGPIVLLSGSNFAGGISNSQSVSFTSPDISTDTTLTFQLTVKDDTLQADTDTVSIIINPVNINVNNPPTANAGVDVTYNENTIITLDGSGSADPDSGDTITYLWQQLQGPTVSFSNTIPSPTFTAPDVTAGNINLQFKLLVKDSANVPSQPDYVTITVSDVPVTPDNNTPIPRNDFSQTTGVTPVTIDVLFNDSDADGDNITVSSVDTTNTSGAVTNNNNSITFTANESFSGSTTFTYTIIDSHGAVSIPAQVTVDVFAPQNTGNAAWVSNHPNFISNDHFGQSVDFLSNGNILVGAPDHSTYGSVTILSGTDGTEILTITNPQNTSDDFGYSISSWNNGIVVGSPLYDVGSNVDAGAVYVLNSAGALAFSVIQNPEPSSYDKFGISVATNTNRIFVGAPAHDVVTLNLAEPNGITQTFDSFVISSSNGTDSITDLNLIANTTANTIGIVDYSTGNVISEIIHFTSYNPETLLSTDTLDAFALSVDIISTDGNDFADVGVPPVLLLNHTANTMSLVDDTTGTTLVSSTIPETQNDLILFYNELTQTSYVYDGTTGVLVLTEFGNAGAVYVYDSTTGTHITPPINNPNPASNDSFGVSIGTMSNGNVIVGVPGDDSNGSSSGSVYIFDGVTKSQLFYIVNPSASSGASDDFGIAVSSAENYIIIGAPDDSGINNVGPSRSGAIYVYDGTTGTQKAYLPAATHAVGVGSSDDFGESVAGSADGTILLGSSIDSEYVLAFSFDGTNATLTQKIDTPDDTASNDFGYSIAASNGTIVISDPLHSPHTSGAVFLYNNTSSANSNVPPVATNDNTTVQEDSTFNIIQVLNNDSDADGDAIIIDAINLSGTHGTATISENGDTILFTPALNYDGTTTLSYRITDGNGRFSVGTVTITVTNVNDSPVSKSDYITTDEEQPVIIPVLDNDSDIDGDTLSVYSVNASNTAGTVTNNGDTITFTPSNDYNGDTRFTYITTDNNGSLSASSLVVVIVNPVNDAPVATNDDDITTPEDVSVIIPVLDNDSDVDIITAEIQAAESLAAFDVYSDILLSQVSGTTNNDGTFVAYSDEGLSEIRSRVSSLPADDSTTQNRQPDESIKDIKSQITAQRDIIKTLKQEKNNANDYVNAQKDIFAKLNQDSRDATKQHKAGNITDEALNTIKADLTAQRVTLYDANQNLSDAKILLKNARDDIKISKGVKNILQGKATDLDPRLAKITFSNNVMVPVSIKTFANYTNTMTPQDIGVDLYITQSDGTISAILNESQIKSLSQSEYVHSITLPHLPEIYTVSQGVISSYANLIHNESITGDSITVAVIDDSFVLTDTKLSSAFVTHSALYDSVGFCGGALSCGKTSGNSHGTATAGIILDMAPDVNLQLYTITSSADFVNAIYDIISRGDADVISVSLGFPTLGGDGTTGYFRDGTSSVAKAVNHASNSEIITVVAAGNDAKRHWSGNYNASGISPSTIGLTGYDSLMQFQPGVSGLHNACLPVSHGGWTVLSWDSWKYTNLDYDTFLYNGTMSGVLSYSASAQSEVAGEPLEVIYGSTYSDACIVVALSENSNNNSTSQDSLLHINTVRGSVNNGLSMVQSSISTPADSAGAVTVGAVNYMDSIPEPFSSAGPTDDGRDKPEICGFDGVTTTQGSFDPFFGTSSAAPHVAGAAALLLQAYPNNSTSQVTSSIFSSSAPSDSTLCGAGILSLQNISVDTNVNSTGTGGNSNAGTGDVNGNGTRIEPPIVTVGADSISIQSIVISPTHGVTKIVSDGTAISYTPNLNYHGLDSFEYGIIDNFGETDTATVSLNITSVNDAPFVTPIIDYTIKPQNTLSFTAVAVDVDDSDTLTFSLSNQPSGATIDGTTGFFSWTPDNSQTGDHTFDVMVFDDGTSTPSSNSITYALSDSESLTVTVVTSSTTHKISASDGLSYDIFGVSTSVDGNTLIVGSTLDGGNGAGSVYVFENSNSTWTQTAKLIQDNPKRFDRFGGALSMSGDTLFVGFPSYDDNIRGKNLGSVYIFEKDAGVWQKNTQLILNDGKKYDMFGVSVSVNSAGNMAIVGSPYYNVYGYGSGAVTIFEKNATTNTWNQTAHISPSDGAKYDYFGYTVNIHDENTIAVSSLYDKVASHGTVRVYEKNSNDTWELTAKLSPDDTPNHFGRSSAMWGDTIAVGAEYYDNTLDNMVGAVYTFENNGTAWSQSSKLIQSDFIGGDYFGYSLSLSNGILVSGTPNFGSWYTGVNSFGSAYIYEQNNNTWNTSARVGIPVNDLNDDFGKHVSVSSNGVVLASAPYGKVDEVSTGYVKVYSGDFTEFDISDSVQNMTLSESFSQNSNSESSSPPPRDFVALLNYNDTSYDPDTMEIYLGDEHMPDYIITGIKTLGDDNTQIAIHIRHINLQSANDHTSQDEFTFIIYDTANNSEKLYTVPVMPYLSEVTAASNTNLLHDPYSVTSWDVITNGGNGWLDYSSGQTNWVAANQTFATSYKWNEKSITIPFNGIDGTLTITEDYSKTYCGDFTDNTYKNQIPYDQYYLTIELFDINNNLLTDNSTGIIQIIEPCDWSRNWHTAELTISEIPQSTSSIIVTHGGISGEYWAGWYGPVMRNIELIHTG